MSETTCPACKRTIPESPERSPNCPYCDQRLADRFLGDDHLRRDTELCRIAHAHRRLLWVLLVSLPCQALILLEFPVTWPPRYPTGVVIIYLGISLLICRAMVGSLWARRKHPAVVVLSALPSLVPIGNLLLMEVEIRKAASALKSAGVVIGPFGASDDRVRRRIKHKVCRCGYDLTGNVSRRCPECGTKCN